MIIKLRKHYVLTCFCFLFYTLIFFEDSNSRDKDLHTAEAKRCTNSLKKDLDSELLSALLLDLGANSNICNNTSMINRNMPFHFACAFGNIALIQVLVQNFTDAIDITSPEQLALDTPLHLGRPFFKKKESICTYFFRKKVVMYVCTIDIYAFKKNACENGHKSTTKDAFCRVLIFKNKDTNTYVMRE
ncbi:hypothetical protein RFI_30942 [Reticulomyxa filosa]|uniref:Uncharacterized protein n=1 Tax=Reticulomyxa filosa TaxID=46433 RepID=X6M0F8_RETFI|nr:hypothetical protein RFI_30942 [Reticulomyxa filosa]|eukprot:ETO06450.1 hypothetical protein RFI_30942 [Reticulomyxa filosa]